MTKTWPHILTALPKDFENGSILFRDRPSSRLPPVSSCAAFLPETDGGFQSFKISLVGPQQKARASNLRAQTAPAMQAKINF